MLLNKMLDRTQKERGCCFYLGFNTTCLNSADVSPGMETAPKSSFDMIESGHGNKETSPVCIQMYVSYGMDSEIQVQGAGKGSG